MEEPVKMCNYDLIESLMFYEVIFKSTSNPNESPEQIKEEILTEIGKRLNVSGDIAAAAISQLNTQVDIAETLRHLQGLISYMRKANKVDWEQMDMIHDILDKLVETIEKIPTKNVE